MPFQKFSMKYYGSNKKWKWNCLVSFVFRRISTEKKQQPKIIFIYYLIRTKQIGNNDNKVSVRITTVVVMLKSFSSKIMVRCDPLPLFDGMWSCHRNCQNVYYKWMDDFLFDVVIDVRNDGANGMRWSHAKRKDGKTIMLWDDLFKSTTYEN